MGCYTGSPSSSLFFTLNTSGKRTSCDEILSPKFLGTNFPPFYHHILVTKKIVIKKSPIRIKLKMKICHSFVTENLVTENLSSDCPQILVENSISH